MRSINTSVAAILPVLSLLVLGSEILGAIALREFSVALLVGITTGAYSSIFIATPLLAILKERESKFKNLRGSHLTGEALVQMVVSGHAVTGRARRSEGATASEASASPASAPTSAGALLTHPPRPRKKRRR
jgi:preprotein translocase subunit SecF